MPNPSPRLAASRRPIPLALATLLAAASLPPPSAAAEGARRGAEASALTTHPQQGRYFRWAMPAGWKSSESTNGVDLTAPDGSAWAGSSLLTRAPQAMPPLEFLKASLTMIGAKNLRILSSRDLPAQPSGIPGAPWRAVEAETSHALQGRPYRCAFTVAASGFYGSNSYLETGYCAEPQRWEALRASLAQVAASIVVTNPAQVAGNDQIILPKNHPNDSSGIMGSWERKRASQDRIAKQQHETTMGTERVKDPQTGRVYEMPFEKYDATVGGYRNPVRPNELLEKTKPGE